ncbi:MAG: hypothetical protein V4638_05030 [Bacteroidota bacterium]
MKFLYCFLILATLTACPSRGSQNSSKLVLSSKMDLPQLEQRVHGKIKFKLSKLFEGNYSNGNLTVQPKGFEKSIPQLGMYFTVESFDENYCAKLRLLREDTVPNLELIHSYYVNKRSSTLNFQETSVRKNVSKSVGFEGFTQVVAGSTYSSSSSPSNSYFISSIAIDKKIYVFQMIGPQKNMGYFYDDYLKILNSIEK